MRLKTLAGSLLLLASTCFGATISVGAHCGSGDPTAQIVNTGTSCSVTTFDRFGATTTSATASVSLGDAAVSVFSSISGTRFIHSVDAAASFRETYHLTFYGGSGLGVFLPSLEAAGFATGSFAVTGGDSIAVSGFGPLSNTNALALSPNLFRFTFGEPMEVEVFIRSSSPALQTGGLATFRKQFRAGELDAAGTLVTPLPDATWYLEAVPEPSSFSLVAFGVLALVASWCYATSHACRTCRSAVARAESGCHLSTQADEGLQRPGE